MLSACSGPQSSSTGGPVAATSATASSATTTQPALIGAPVTTSAPVAISAPTDACASATKTTLEAALAANKQISSALEIDGSGLHDIKCAAPWAIAGFSNKIDGGSVLFNQENGAWVAKDGGTDVCSDLPDATAKQLCG
jgi:hypothetical protein